MKDGFSAVAYLVDISRSNESGIAAIRLNSFRSEPEIRSSQDEGLLKILVVMMKEETNKLILQNVLSSDADNFIIRPLVIEEINSPIASLSSEGTKSTSTCSGLHENILLKATLADDRFIERVVLIIDENISNFDFDVGILHERLGMSRMHLSRKLKIITGLSPHILIRNMRLEKAADLLLRNAGNITEIANSVGISNASGFSKAFREYFGVSPKKFSQQ